MESVVLPWIAVVIISKKIIGKYSKILNQMEWFVLILISILLIMDGLKTSTIIDAIILGSLALLSVIGGFYFKYKSYFFVGIGVLLLNVLLQTRPYWGNFPWWAYLLIAGSLLITVASIYEMQKQKSGKKIILYLSEWKKRIKIGFDKWK
jgi:hypothetical protein